MYCKILQLNRCRHDSSPSSFRFKSYLLTTYHKGRHWAGVFLNVAGSSGICLSLRNTWWWELEHCRASLAICHLCFSNHHFIFFDRYHCIWSSWLKTRSATAVKSYVKVSVNGLASLVPVPYYQGRDNRPRMSIPRPSTVAWGSEPHCTTQQLQE